MWPEVLREFFTRFFGVGGGITLEHCTATEDGIATALEFNAVQWGAYGDAAIRQASRCTSAVRRAGSPRRASTTTSTRRSTEGWGGLWGSNP